MGWHLPPLTPHFHAALRDVDASSPDARIRAAQRLSLAEGDELGQAQTALVRLSVDDHPGVRATAVAGLAEVGQPQHLAAVVARIDDPSAEVRELSVMAVGRIGGCDAEAVLVRALDSDAAEVRFQAVAALAELLGEGALNHLLSRIEDEDPQVRAQVAESLGRVCAEHTRGHLARLLEDPAASVRLEAALALTQLGDARGEPELVAAVQARHRLDEVCMALGPVANVAGREAMRALYERVLVSAPVRLTAAAGLALAGDPRGVEGLRKGLGSFWQATRNCAVDLCGRVRCTALTAELAALVGRPRAVDPQLLAEALIALAGDGADVENALSVLARGDGEGGDTARRFLLRVEESTAMPD